MLQGLRTLETENKRKEVLISNFPTLPSMKTSLYRARQDRLPQMPSARDGISIEGDWDAASKGRFFLSSDSNEIKKKLRKLLH